MRSLAFIGLGLVLISHATVSQSTRDSRRNAWQEFQANQGSAWQVEWNEEIGVPRLMYGPAITQITKDSETPEGTARGFLKLIANVTGMKQELLDLRHLRTQTHKGISVIEFTQQYGSLRVISGEYSVVVDSLGRVHMASGNYYPQMKLRALPFISPSEVMQLATKEFMSESAADRPTSVELIVYPLAGSAKLAYEVNGQIWKIIIDANRGTTILKTMRIAFDGYVYEKNPIATPLVSVPVLSLLDQYWLRGTYSRHLNAEYGEPFGQGGGNFFFTPPAFGTHDNTYFDDVNVYYHIQKFATQYAASFGAQPSTQILATTHDPYPFGHDNATADWSNLTMRVGHGQTIFWDLSKQDDILYHEYAHMTAGWIGLGYSFDQEKALHEGYADYMAASFTQDPYLAEWVTKCTDVG